MSFETTVYTALANDPSLQGLCPRLYPQQPVDNVPLPFAWYRFYRRDNLVFGGVASGISNYTVEINVFAPTLAAVNQIAARVIALLDGFSTLPDVGSLVLDEQAERQKADGYIYFVKSLRFSGLGT